MGGEQFGHLAVDNSSQARSVDTGVHGCPDLPTREAGAARRASAGGCGRGRCGGCDGSASTCTSTTSVISVVPSISRAQLGFLLSHPEPALAHGVADLVGEPRCHRARLGRRGRVLQLLLRPLRACDTGGRSGREPKDSFHRRRNLLAARDVPDAIATVLITGVENAALATLDAPSTEDEIASADPSTLSKRSRSPRASSTDRRISASNGCVSAVS